MDPRSHPCAAAPFSGARRLSSVAFVDDDPEVLHAYARMLRGEPYEMLTFQNPGRVLEWIEDASLDVILSDERMPRMSGTDLVEEVGRRSPGTRFALVTAYPDPAVVARRTGVPIGRILTKPLGAEELKAAVRGLLREPPGESGGAARRLELASGKADPRRLEATIDLAGASRAAVLDQLIPLAIWAHASGERPVVNLRNMQRLAEPVPSLLEDLLRSLSRLDARLIVRDESGQIAQWLRSEPPKRTA